jgi:RHS repeat-associated protein
MTKTSPSGFNQFAYDARNLMTEARTGADVHAYGYDVDGARISKSVNGVLAEAFLVDRNMPHAQVLRETNGAGTENARHVYGIDEVLWSATAAGLRFMHYDGQRSVRALSDAAGALVDGYAFDAFGNALASSGSTPNDYRYSGERLDDETGLIHLRARQYDPSSGRFMGADPFLAVYSDPRTLHRYAYAGNGAMNMRDPSGRFTLIEASITVGLIYSVVATYVGATAVIEASTSERAWRLAMYRIVKDAAVWMAYDMATEGYVFMTDRFFPGIASGDVQREWFRIAEGASSDAIVPLTESDTSPETGIPLSRRCAFGETLRGYTYDESTTEPKILLCDETLRRPYVGMMNSSTGVFIHEVGHWVLGSLSDEHLGTSFALPDAFQDQMERFFGAPP